MTLNDEPGFKNASYLLKPVVYVLCHFDTVQYVGSSLNADNRIYRHRLEGRFEFNRVYVKPVRKAEMITEELRLIRVLEPEFNTAGAYRKATGNVSAMRRRL